MSILFKGNLEEGNYTLIKSTDGWVLKGETSYVGFNFADRKTEPQTDYKKWDAPPKVKLPTGEITTCVSVLAAAFEEAAAFEDKLQMERSE